VNTPKVLRFISIAVLTGAGLILPVTPSYAATIYHIYYSNSGSCIGNDSSGDSVLSPCASIANQEWHIRTQVVLNGVTYNQWENGNNKCLDSSGSADSQIVVRACGSSSDQAQLWQGPVISNGDTYSAFVNDSTAQCVTIRVPAESGPPIYNGPCMGSLTGLWWAD
jgi:hypothetical protein